MYLNPPFFSVSCMNNHGVFVRPLGRDVWAFCFGGCDERSSSDQLCACSVFTLTRVCSLTQSCPALQTQGLWPTRLLSLAFPRQECWSGLPCSPGDGPDPGIKPASPALAGGFFTSEPAGKPGSHSPRGKYLKVEFPSHRAGVWFNSEKVPDHFPKWLLCWLLFKIYESNWGFGLCRDSA